MAYQRISIRAIKKERRVLTTILKTEIFSVFSEATVGCTILIGDMIFLVYHTTATKSSNNSVR